MRHLRLLYRYNSDVRKRYLDLFERLPWQVLVKDRGASFPSLRDIFVHVLNAYRGWFVNVYGDDLGSWSRIMPSQYNSVDDLRRLDAEIDALVLGIVERTTEADLERTFLHDEDTGDRITLEALLLHMVEEELQHRGEMNCILWQLDIDPPIVEYHEWVAQPTA